MSEPLTAGVAAGSAGVTFAALFPEATPAVMICALAGAALYVLSSGQHRFWKQVIFALISFVGGVYCAETAMMLSPFFCQCRENQFSVLSRFYRFQSNRIHNFREKMVFP